jgi:hypothetical protein
MLQQLRLPHSAMHSNSNATLASGASDTLACAVGAGTVKVDGVATQQRGFDAP